MCVRSTEIPVLWVGVDPEGQWIKSIELEQSDSTWQYVLKHERNAVTQIKAARALSMHATPITKATLMETIMNKNLYYRVRLEAAEALVKVLNSLATSGVSSSAIISLYQRLYCSQSCPTILRYHDFSDIAEYELQKSLPVYAASTRALHGQCTKEVLQFILDILKYSDNRLNKFTDSFHTAAVMDALAAFVTPTVSVMATLTKDISLKTLPDGIQLLLKEAVLRLNLEKVVQSHQFVVTVSCLKILRVLQKNGYLPNDASLFTEYARYGHFISVRLTAVTLLAEVLQETENEVELDYLLKIAESDPVPAMRIAVLQSLSASPPFTRKKESALNTLTLVERLWKDMSELSHDARLRNAFMELYSALYGRLTPTCLPQGLGIVIDLKGKVARASLGSPGTLSDDIPIPGPSTSGFTSLFPPSQSGAASITEISKSLPSDIFDDDSADISPPPAKRPTLDLGLQEGTTLSSLSGVSGSTDGLGSPASLLLADEGQSSRKKHKKEKNRHKKKKKHKHKEQK